MKDLFDRENIRMLHKKGEEHGTITCRINDKENFEITTLRIDEICDGRRAKVSYTTDWHLDAYRRDLTINSLFLDGTVYDYTGGIEDIKERRITFVGNPVIRIQEDFLRILRYFRFFGRYAKTHDAHLPENLDAIKDRTENGKFVPGVSGERIWMEFKKILVGRFAAPLLRTMLEECNLNEELCLPQNTNLKEFERVAEANKNLNEHLNLEPSTALSALLNTMNDVEQFQKYVKFSNTERVLCEFIVAKREEALYNKDNLLHFKLLILDQIFVSGINTAEEARKRTMELIKYVEGFSVLNEIINWKIDLFPVGGLDMMNIGVKKGPIMKQTLNDLKLNKDELITRAFDDEVKNVMIGEKRQQPDGMPKFKKRRQ